MSRASTQHGYALLAALVVITLAAVFAAAAVAGVSARQAIVRADAANARARAAARLALGRVCLELRRDPAALEGHISSAPAAGGDAAWTATWSGARAPGGSAWPEVAVEVQAACADAKSRLSATLRVCPERVPQGLVVAGDAELRAPLQIAGSGLYCGGSLRGREWLHFGGVDQADTPPPADGVHADPWPLAGVHALGGIWAQGQEVHSAVAAAGASAPPDTDTHTGDNDVTRLVAPPETSLRIALRDAAVAPGAALRDGVLDLSELPASRPAGLGGSSGGSYVVLASTDADGEVRLVGTRLPGASPIVLVIEGDAAMGGVGVQTEFVGAMIVGGRLRVEGPSTLRGHLFAGGLLVTEPLTVELASDWRATPLAGLGLPLLISLDRP